IAFGVVTRAYEDWSYDETSSQESVSNLLFGEHPILHSIDDGLQRPVTGHRCKHINPSTGKPCNSVFSRLADLTRHEGTIHNAHKQKARCYLCTEEKKTFSRNDALTRHMRMVHPE